MLGACGLGEACHGLGSGGDGVTLRSPGADQGTGHVDDPRHCAAGQHQQRYLPNARCDTGIAVPAAQDNANM